MTLNPDVLTKAQEEIDRVIGKDRLPNFGDRPNLPYLECVLRETYRWNPAAPLGVAHRLTENDVYEGHLIPKGMGVPAPSTYSMFLMCGHLYYRHDDYPKYLGHAAQS